jgi:membrane protease YdiL (CAAX protease family)
VLVAGTAVALRVGWLIKTKQLLPNDFLSFSDSKNAIIYYGAFTTLGVAGLWLFQDALPLSEWLISDNVLWLMPIHILLQELIFRTYLISRLKTIFKNQSHLIVLVAASIFALTHFILPDALPVVLLTLISGLVWSYLYLRFPNLLYVWLSHLALDLALHFIY